MEETNVIINDNEFRRSWVDSESFTINAKDGFRVLDHGWIIERKGDFEGRWVGLRPRLENEEIAVLDKGMIKCK